MDNIKEIKKFCHKYDIDSEVFGHMVKLQKISEEFNYKKFNFIKSKPMTNHDYLPLAINYFADYCQDIAGMKSVTFNTITDRLHRHNKKDVKTLKKWFHQARDSWWNYDNNINIYDNILPKETPFNLGKDRLTDEDKIYKKYVDAFKELYKMIFSDVQPIILGRIGEDYVCSMIRKGINNYNNKYQLGSNLNDSVIWKDKNLYFKYLNNTNKTYNNQMDIIVVNAGGVFIYEVKTLSDSIVTLDDKGILEESFSNQSNNSSNCNVGNQIKNHKDAIENIIRYDFVNGRKVKSHINPKFIHSKVVLVRNDDSTYENNNKHIAPLKPTECVKYMKNESKNAILNPQQINFIIKQIKNNEINHEKDLSGSTLANYTGITHPHLIENNQTIINKFSRYIRILSAISNLKKMRENDLF